MPNMKKNDGDAYAGVAFAAGCQRAQDACGMTDCGQACAKVGEAGDPAVLEQVTLKTVPVVHPDDLDVTRQQQQQQEENVVTAQWVG